MTDHVFFLLGDMILTVLLGASRYNFDPQKEEPLPGRFEWTPLRLELPRSSTSTSTTTTTSPESSTEVQKEELVDSTMSPS
jgi:hypothetical protein